jgi:serine/threonine protein kinase
MGLSCRIVDFYCRKKPMRFTRHVNARVSLTRNPWVILFELTIPSQFASFASSGHNALQVSYTSRLIFTMPVALGTRLGSLEITALLGKRGMGEVYRARDTRLKREVAIKILPEEFSCDADRVARFQREAEVLASLNHPNIAAIYDLEEDHGSRFLVLELVEGETLADRIARGPIPIDEALQIAKSSCEALEAAHEQGIVEVNTPPTNDPFLVRDFAGRTAAGFRRIK